VTAAADPELPADYLSAHQAVDAAGISYRQLDYWVTTGLIQPAVWKRRGSGSARRFSPEDVEALKVVSDLLRYGVTVRAVRWWTPQQRIRVRDALHATLQSFAADIAAEVEP
jgi:DNA-binding transcriptional MerR regulator